MQDADCPGGWWTPKKWSRGPGKAQDGGWELLGRVAGTERSGRCGGEDRPRECAGWEIRRWEAVDSTPKEGDSVIW